MQGSHLLLGSPRSTAVGSPTQRFSLGGELAEATVAESLAPLVGERDGDGESIFPRPEGASIDTLLLGCTHYPLIKTKIQNYVGERIHVIDSAQPTALALKRMLAEQHMRSPEARPTQVYFTSDDPSRSMNIAENFLGEPLELEKLAL